MNVTLPIWIVVMQWVLLIGLGVLVILMYRQFAYYVGLRDRTTETKTVDWGLRPGQAAPSFVAHSMNGDSSVFLPSDTPGRWRLLVFADPYCGTCERGLAALRQVRDEAARDFPVITIVTNASPAIVAAAGSFAAFGDDVAFVHGAEALERYDVRRTPFAFLLDPNGIIETSGVLASRKAIHDLLISRDTGVHTNLGALVNVGSPDR